MKKIFLIAPFCYFLSTGFAQNSEGAEIIASISNAKSILSSNMLNIVEDNISNTEENKKEVHETSPKRTLVKAPVVSTVNGYSTTFTRVFNFNKETVENSDGCSLTYFVRENAGEFKYGLKLEGRIKDYTNKSSNIYISLNSAVDPTRFTMVPADNNGRFSVVIDDDSIKGITIIKKGIADKEISFAGTLEVFANAEYAFDITLGKRIETYAKNVAKKAEATYNKLNNSSNTSILSNSEVYFGFNKSTLNGDAIKTLKNIIETIKSENSYTNGMIVEINGFTDSKGSKAYNKELSKKRSIACKAYLAKNGLSNVEVSLITNAKGSIESDTKSLDDEQIRAKNRKAEIIIKRIIANAE